MVWDGTRWVRETSAAGRPNGPRHIKPKRLLALAVAAVVVGGLVGAALPAPPSAASSPVLSLDPAMAAAGAVVQLHGEHLLPFVPYQLTWDGSAAGQPQMDTDQVGDLVGTWTVPDASPGEHQLSLFPIGHIDRTMVAATASAPFAVLPGSTALPDPSASPNPTDSAAPTPSAPPLPAPVAPGGVSTGPKPTPRATPKPAKAPPPAPRPPASPWSVPFLSRPASGAIVVRDRSNVVISGKRFVNLPGDQVAITIENSHNVTVTANDFSGNIGDIYVVDSTNVTVTWNRYRNVGNGTEGSGASNFVQFSRTTGGTIAHNKGVGGNTEDIVSIYRSGGSSAAHPLLIEYNSFEGGDWSSGSGSGIMLGDGGGSHIVVAGNVLVTPGQVGIGISGGTDIHVVDNLVYGAKRAGSNVGISIWNQSPGSCSGNEIGGNKVTWYAANGSKNGAWDGGGCGSVVGWSSNDWDAGLSYSHLHVVL